MTTMIFDSVDLQDTLVGMESTLHIQINEVEVSSIIEGSLRKLSSQYTVNFHECESVYKLMTDNPHVATKLESFLSQLGDCLKRIALLQAACVATGNYNVTLASVQNLGFDPQHLAACFKFTILKQLYTKRETFIDQLASATSKLPNGVMKRLLVCMLVLEKIGMFEGVSVISQYLYMGVRVS